MLPDSKLHTHIGTKEGDKEFDLSISERKEGTDVLYLRTWDFYFAKDQYFR